MAKISSVKKAAELSKQFKKKGKTVGLVLGSFDILHMGHINLFRFAKRHADILIVGMDNDKTIKKSKGSKRPINNYSRRSQFLSEIYLVDQIFQINKVFKSGDKNSFKYFENLIKKIKPTHIFTSVKCDELWKDRKTLAESLSIKFMEENSKVMHTSDILRIIESEM